MKQGILIPVFIFLILATGGGAFFGGIKYQQSKSPQSLRQFGQGLNGFNARLTPGQGRTAGASFRPVNGEILSADDKSITVKLTDGSSKIVIFSDKTVINKATAVQKSDLKTGDKVTVLGSANSDGSVTAQSIQLNLAN